MNRPTVRLMFQILVIIASTTLCGTWSRNQLTIVESRGGFSTAYEVIAVFGPVGIGAVITGLVVLWMAYNYNRAVYATPPEPEKPLADTQSFRVLTPDGGVSVSITGTANAALVSKIRELLAFAAGGAK